jgi:anti-anti-sigma regulatory factor
MDEVSAVGERAEFSFTEHDEPDGSVRVCLVGELDAAEAPVLQGALRRLESEGSDVLLDVSGLSFMDLFGLHLIEEAVDAARQGGFGSRSPGQCPEVQAGAEHHLPGGQAHLVAPFSAPPSATSARRARARPIAAGRQPTKTRR